MKMHSGADVVVTAATGVYQSQAQLLDLFGDVTLIHENGTRFVTDSRAGRRREQHRRGPRPGRGARSVRRRHGRGVPDPRQGRHDHLYRQVAICCCEGATPGAATAPAPPAVPAADRARPRRRSKPRSTPPLAAASRLPRAMRPRGAGRRRPARAEARHPRRQPSRRQASRRLDGTSDASETRCCSAPAASAAAALALLGAGGAAVAGAALARVPRRQSADRDPGRFGHRVAAGRASLHRPRQCRRDARTGDDPRRYADRPLPRAKAAPNRAPPTPEARPKSTGSRPTAMSSIKRETQTVVGDRAVYDVDQAIGIVTGKELKLTTADRCRDRARQPRMVRPEADRRGARRRGGDPRRQARSRPTS